MAKTLRDRELKVAVLLARGLTRHQIGDLLELSYTTVANDMRYLRAKTDSHTTTEAVSKLARAGLV